MSVAARTAGWQRRMRNTPGPLAAPSAGSGESPTGLLCVELYLGGWIDITALGLVRYANGVQITSGQPDETSAVNPGSCTMTLDNRDGRFSWLNPLGPYYGVLKKNTPIRVSVQSGLDRSYRFWGEVTVWPKTWDPTGTDIWVDITAAGRLRRLAQGSTPLRSPIALFWSNPPFVLQFPAVAYWPCEDGPSANQIASGLGGAPMTIAGTPTLASYTGFAASNPLPAMAKAEFRGAVPTYTPGTDGIITNETSVVFLLAVPSSGEASQVVCMLIAGGGSARYWEVYYTAGSGGSLGLRSRDLLGFVNLDTGAIPAQTIDGKNLIVIVDIYEAAGSGTGVLNVTDMGTGLTASTSAVVGGVTMGHISNVLVNPSRTLTDTAIGHVTVIPGAYFESTPQAYAGYSGDSAGNRILRLLNSTGITNEVAGSPRAGFVAVHMGPQRPARLQDLILECAAADLGVLYELRDAFGLGYRTHNTLMNQDPALTLSYPAGQLALVPTDPDDDSTVRNDMTVLRTDGSSGQYQQLDGPLSMVEPPGGVGQYDDSVTLNLADDSTLNDQAAWRVHMGTVVEGRHPQIAVQLAHPTFTASTTLRQQALAVALGDRIVVTGPFPVPPHDDISQLVLGSTERIDQFTHSIVWNCRPESPWRTALLEDPVVGRADTDGSQLAADVSSSATSMQVAVTAGPPWVTDPAQFPLDIVVGGERITVGAISGAGSPQTFSSLTRGVNGITKFQAAGSDVRLYQPMVLAL